MEWSLICNPKLLIISVTINVIVHVALATRSVSVCLSVCIVDGLHVRRYVMATCMSKPAWLWCRILWFCLSCHLQLLLQYVITIHQRYRWTDYLMLIA